MTVVGANTASDHRSPPLNSLWRNRTFLVLYLAEAQSVLGDQLARVALSVLVFDRTGSATATALTYAATFLPTIVGGSLLARVGDRRPRRSVMLVSDFARTVLVAAMAVPAAPTALVVGLLVIAVALGPVFLAAQLGVLSLNLDAEQYRTCSALRLATSQAAQVAGFVLGGLVVAWLSPHVALAVDAGTYALSFLAIALVLRAGRERRAPVVDGKAEGGSPLSAWRWIWSERRVRLLVGLAWLAGFFVVPEGLAAPVVLRQHGSEADVGFLLAAIPLGGALGALILLRGVPSRRRHGVASAMALVAGLPLVATAWWPPLPVIALLWGLSGLCTAYQIDVTSAAITRFPESRRSELIGLLASGLTVGQGLGLGLFGLMAHTMDAAMTVSTAGAAGFLAALGILLMGDGHRRHSSKLENTS